MSNYPKADAIIEEMFKDKKLAECMILEESGGGDFYRVYSGIGDVPKFNKMFSLELNYEGEDFYIPTAGWIQRKDFPDMKPEWFGHRAVVIDKELIDKILLKMR